MPIYKGPIFFLPSNHTTGHVRALNDVPVARGVIDEETMIRSGRPMRHKDAAEHIKDCRCKQCKLKRRGLQ